MIPTVTGGAQVVFNDVETLKQKSPLKSPVMTRRSKRSYDDLQAPVAASVRSRAAFFETPETKLGAKKRRGR